MLLPAVMAYSDGEPVVIVDSVMITAAKNRAAVDALRRERDTAHRRAEGLSREIEQIRCALHSTQLLHETSSRISTALKLMAIAACAIAMLTGCTKTDEEVSTVEVRIASQWVVEVVGTVEEGWQAQLSPLRAAAEQFQDEAARSAPLETYAADWSIGRFNIRPSTARSALDWAFTQGIAADFGYDRPLDDEEVVRDIMDPDRAASLVKLILAQLRDDHPGLREKTWDTIEATDQYLAKLYSGYLGAGGAWEAWRSDLLPGDEARLRLGCTDDGTRCTVIRQHRPDAEG